MLGHFPNQRVVLATVRSCAFALLAMAALPVCAEDVPPAPAPPPDPDPISVSAGMALEWREEGFDVTLLRTRVKIEQGNFTASGESAIIWKDAAGRVLLYLEGDARVRGGPARGNSGLIRRDGSGGLELDVASRNPIEQSVAVEDPLYQRALARLKSEIGQSSDEPGRAAVTLVDPMPIAELPAPDPNSELGALRRVRIFPRSAVPYDVLSYESTKTIPSEQIIVLTGGVNLVIDGVQLGETDLVDLSADRIVIWTRTPGGGSEFQAESVQSRDTPFTVYLEGNIVIRQGGRVMRAKKAVYDARQEKALLDDAEIRTFMPDLGAELRVRADRLRQITKSRFKAENAWLSTSKFGKPGYRLQAKEIFLEPRYDVPWLGLGDTVVDPRTGQTTTETPWFRSYDNKFMVHDVPIFYSPKLSGPATDPGIPLKTLSVGFDQIFGARVQTAWDVFSVLGQERPPNVELNVLADYYGKRGPATGFSGRAARVDPLGIPGYSTTNFLGYYVNDGGEDTLGGGLRGSIPIETQNRGRLLYRHQHQFPDGFGKVDHSRMLFEVGVESDRNFLEQYYQTEFRSDKNTENYLYFSQAVENWAWSGLGFVPVNDFDPATGWYPRFDTYGLSEPLFDGRLTWSQHTQAGYGDINPGDLPDPNVYGAGYANSFTPLPYLSDVEGGVFMTRHELAAPLSFGALNVVPFVMGDALFQQQGLTGDDITRFTISPGLRASIQAKKLYRNVHSRLFNVNGLMHKARLEAEYRYTDTTQPLGEIAQYNDLDDDAQEITRMNFGRRPDQFDPRLYGIRTGVGLPVTSPVYELVEDQEVIRLALRQRLQTKRGPPGNLRIQDWMTLDLEASLFPDAMRDNFGEELGLVGFDYRWHVGDRTTLFANGTTEFFENASKTYAAGFELSRGRRGTFTSYFQHIDAGGDPLNMLILSYQYELSPKWLTNASFIVDIQNPENRAQVAQLTRVGADFLYHFTFQNDVATNNVGGGFMIEPRFGPRAANPGLAGLFGLGR
ncbi:LPS-assembly protein LptD [Stratiformator vulcanicus]|uniref:LPS-assembly protein LptD n=1 Tax=Stratiformator vulcanicus TaxID=2527980 RepID=A0A517R6X0_9PLAN|nr:LPS-assembly protein LptD [Stratiformator vulcanicus]QDT39646.1 LPS-assembly protein LptD [Stratiformator vulcanicus]